MALTTQQRIVLQGRLDAAEKAYHDLMVGGAARVVVDQNGERVEYSTTSSTRLAGYIKSLQDQLACKSTSAGPMRVFFR